MIIRQTLNFAAHLAAGIAFGALAVAAYQALNRPDENGCPGASRHDRDQEPMSNDN